MIYVKVFFVIIAKNSSGLISPSPSVSALSIISSNSASTKADYQADNTKKKKTDLPLIVSPNSLATRFKFLKEILPL
jgi:phage portal protein BeeE